MKTFKDFISESVPFKKKGGMIVSPTGEKIRSFSTPDTKDRMMPQILNTMPTPKERQIKNFWTGGKIA